MAEKIRDHLANERTFLAWVRTALGLIGLGFVLARMGLFLRQFAVSAGSGAAVDTARSLHAGHEFILTGVVFLLIGTAFGAGAGWVYASNRNAIDADTFTPAWWPVVALTAVVVTGSLVITGLVLWRVLAGG